MFIWVYISTELTSVDLGVETYKTDNRLTDIQYEAGLVLESNSELEAGEIVDVLQLPWRN